MTGQRLPVGRDTIVTCMTGQLLPEGRDNCYLWDGRVWPGTSPLGAPWDSPLSRRGRAASASTARQHSPRLTRGWRSLQGRYY